MVFFLNIVIKLWKSVLSQCRPWQTLHDPSWLCITSPQRRTFIWALSRKNNLCVNGRVFLKKEVPLPCLQPNCGSWKRRLLGKKRWGFFLFCTFAVRASWTAALAPHRPRGDLSPAPNRRSRARRVAPAPPPSPPSREWRGPVGLPRCLATAAARRGAEVRAGPGRRSGGLVRLPGRLGACSRCEGRSGVSRGSLRAGRTRGAEAGIVSACGASLAGAQRGWGRRSGTPPTGLEVEEDVAPAGVRVVKL